MNVICKRRKNLTFNPLTHFDLLHYFTGLPGNTKVSKTSRFLEERDFHEGKSKNLLSLGLCKKETV